jgi:uncharacterized damage-inducible protein DinB
MKSIEGLLREFDHEMANTRKVLERIPEDKFSWKPHAKSFSAGKLATHVANLPSWIGMTLHQDSLDISGSFTSRDATSRAELLEIFDRNVTKARADLAEAADEVFFQPWSLKSGDEVFFTMPKIAVIRSWVMNHNIHHRAQLGVYLRLNDLPVPALYGPSADENPM